MKRGKFVILAFCLLVAGSIALSSCIKENNGETIALIGTEYYVDDILSMIPQPLIQEFESRFGSIPTGSVPDSIEGSYVVDPYTLVATNAFELFSPIEYQNIYMRFSKQHNGIAVLELGEATNHTTDTVYVMGKDRNFTVYGIEEKTTTLNVYVKRGIIICGTLTDAGIDSLRMASIIKEVDGDEGLAPGYYYIYKDGNGLADTCSWQP